MAYFTSQRYASAVYADVMCPSVRPSAVCHKPILYRNNWRDPAGFWHGCFLTSTLC